MSEKLRRLLAIQLFWCVPTTVGALGMYRLPWPDRLFVQAIMWMSWSIPTVIVFLVGDRWPPSRAHAGRTLLLALGLGALCIPGEILITVLTWIHWGMIQGPVLSALVRNLRAVGDSFLVTYVGILLAFVALRWFDQWRQALVVNARLGEDLARAQLDALRAQVNPHFLFNALASVVALIGRDPAAAERTVVALADLLRGTLALADRQEIALDEELDVARRYLAIEQTRFGDRLEVRWDVPAEVLGARVPSLALQPLVENAIVHGFGRITGRGVLEISARRDGASLVLRVRDNGPGPGATATAPGLGIGLGNLRSRLARLHGDAADVAVVPAPGGGCDATITLPWEVATEVAVRVPQPVGVLP